ncbi:MAG: TadE family protein [Anaerolineae bacterium]
MVELSFSSILLCLLVLAAFELGMVFSSYAAVINASRAAATYASMHPSPLDDEYGRYADVARNELRAAHLDMSQVQVLLPNTPEGTQPGRPLSVTVRYTLRTFTSSIGLPVFGRLGMPSYYVISWTTTVPIR